MKRFRNLPYWQERYLPIKGKIKSRKINKQLTKPLKTRKKVAKRKRIDDYCITNHWLLYLP
jgi:hypothetical protein